MWYIFRGAVDESGEQFVAYFLPTEDTLKKRKRDEDDNNDYVPEEEYVVIVIVILYGKLG